MSSHPAHHHQRGLDEPPSGTSRRKEPEESSRRGESELGRADSNGTVAVTLAIGIGLILILLALPYLGRL